MSWTLLVGLVLVLGLALAAAAARRLELARMERAVRARDTAARHGAAEAQLQHPVVDLSRCLGCATCVAVCPEDGVLALVHGQAQVVHGARCQGISACERECPVGAITVTIANLESRTDVPALTEGLEAVGTPGLFLAGEVTAHALIETAVRHGAAVGAEVARRAQATNGSRRADVLDLCVVGAGPAGLACSLEAKRQGLSFVTVDQERELGGTVAKYPRRKLVVTRPIEMPLHGPLGGARARTSYTKEELVELWAAMAAQHELPIRCGEVLEGVERDPAGHFLVRTSGGVHAARHVCLALGRRGTPNRLGVPGEDLPKVAHALLDAHSFQGRRLLVVGGGDSAVETALALAEQPGNRVTLSYRRGSFFRIRARNQTRLDQALAAGRLELLLESEVLAIRPDAVELALRGQRVELGNDEVFVMAGGVAPTELLGAAGVSFDPALRPAPRPVLEQGTGLLRALACGFALALLALGFALWHADYYLLTIAERPAHDKHLLLRPGMGVGLGLGLAAAALIALNLAYLIRRSPRFRHPAFQSGSLKAWMTSHVATGILAFLCALLHGAMAPRDTVGGHALLALGVLLATGAVGRYFYAWVPRAANGRELELAEVKARLAHLADEGDGRQRAFGESARDEVLALVAARQWKGSFAGRVLALAGVQLDLRRVLRRLSERGTREGIPPEQVRTALELARRAHATALSAAHYEDLRAVLDSWRWLHRWVALLMVLLVVLHVIYALTYSAHFFDADFEVPGVRP